MDKQEKKTHLMDPMSDEYLNPRDDEDQGDMTTEPVQSLHHKVESVSQPKPQPVKAVEQLTYQQFLDMWNRQGKLSTRLLGTLSSKRMPPRGDWTCDAIKVLVAYDCYIGSVTLANQTGALLNNPGFDELDEIGVVYLKSLP